MRGTSVPQNVAPVHDPADDHDPDRCISCRLAAARGTSAEDLHAARERSAARCGTEHNTSLRVLVGVLRVAERMAYSHMIDHPADCRCVGCRLACPDDLSEIRRDVAYVLRTLETFGDFIDNQIILGVEHLLTADTYGGDLRFLAGLSDEADELWDRERDEDGGVIDDGQTSDADAPAAVVS